MNETTGTQSDRDWAFDFHEEARFWILGVLTPIVVTIGVLGNAVTIVVLTRKRMKSSTNIYLTALAVADIVFLLLNLVLSFWHHPAMKDPSFYPLWRTWGTIIWLNDASSGTSTWLTVSFTLERYIAVCHPLRGKIMCTESRAKKVILWVTILSLLITSPTPFEYTATITTEKGRTISSASTNSLGNNRLYKTIIHNLSIVLFTFIPFFLLLILNSLLIMAVRQSQRRRSGLTEDTRGIGGSVRGHSILKKGSKLLKKNTNNELDDDSQRPSRITSSKRGYKERQENKITIALVSVVCLFLICQAPSAIMLIVGIFYSPADRSPGDHIVRGLNNLGNFMMLINAMANFLLYCAMSDKYRQTLTMTFCPSSFKHKRSSTFTSVASFRNSAA